MDFALTFHAPNRETWRAWLEQNHADTKEVWLIYFKPHAKQPSVSYEDSVEEALCFGWVDSLIQKIDEDRYARKFTPRRMDSVWSETNKWRAAKVIAEERMTAAGLAKITYPLDEPSPAKKAFTVPDWIVEGLKTSPLAWKNFSSLPPSHQKRYAAWLSSAKKEETRQKNLQKAIKMLEENRRLEMNTRTGSKTP
jgi:uncharacterized protein YdeI (YjbR/CyaY-like superfamily)